MECPPSCVLPQTTHIHTPVFCLDNSYSNFKTQFKTCLQKALLSPAFW